MVRISDTSVAISVKRHSVAGAPSMATKICNIDERIHCAPPDIEKLVSILHQL